MNNLAQILEFASFMELKSSFFLFLLFLSFFFDFLALAVTNIQGKKTTTTKNFPGMTISNSFLKFPGCGNKNIKIYIERCCADILKKARN